MDKIIECHPFEPFIPNNAKVLMLGTFPPKPERWSMDFFYPNWINDMWRIMGCIFYGNEKHFVDGEHRRFDLPRIKQFLNDAGIALFDTGVKVIRHKDNASDKFLEIVERVDLPVAEQLHLPSAAHVAGSERHLGQVVGAGRLRFGLGASHLFGPDGQLQVGAFGHQHARVERERALCPRCQRKAREHNGK